MSSLESNAGLRAEFGIGAPPLGTFESAEQPARSRRRREAPTCRHCGSPLLDERMMASGFCCAGCSYVFRLVHERGLDSYYRIKDTVTAPADAAVFEVRDFSWLQQAQTEAEQGACLPDGTPTVPELTVDVQGISCAACVWLIERVFQQQPGARDIEANAQLGQMRFRWIVGEFSALELARKLQAFGYLLGPLGDATQPPESRAILKRVGLCAAFAMNVMLFALPAYFGLHPSERYASLFGWLTFGFATLSFLVGGTYFVGRAVRALREGALHIDLPIALGVVAAYAGSTYGWLAGQERFVYFDFVATFVLLMLIGRWAQVAAVERNQRRLLSRQPKPARVRLDNGREIGPEEIRIGDTFFVGSGQTVAVDARLAAGDATFSLASINGEAEPRTFRAGQRVPAGAVNVGRSEIALVAQQIWRDSLLAQLLRPAPRATSRHQLLEKIVRGYLIGIILVALGSGLAWWFTTHDPQHTWSVVTAVLVVSCPCAIGLAFPLADEMATVALRRRGVFVRSDGLWSKIGRVRKLVFDKTGTLTLETPVLVQSHAIATLEVTARAALYVLVRDTPHPVTDCLREALLGVFGPQLEVATHQRFGAGVEVRETIGAGVEFNSGGQTWSLGRPGWRSTNEPPPHPLARPERTSDVELVCDGQIVSRFSFTDTPREDARAELAALQTRGFQTYILSGDRLEKVATLAAQIGVPAAQAHGELTPNQKAVWIEANDAKDTLMLGDGANDSLAFDRAYCRGTPVIHRGVLEQKADFYYLGRGINGLRALFDIDRIRHRAQVTILLFSVAYNLLAVGLAVAGLMNPIVAAIMMPVNSLITLALVTGGMRRAFLR